MTLDAINGSYEALGALFNAWNCCVLYRQKVVRGVSVWPSVFFASWGLWNLVYYPMLGQWLSFSGGVLLSAFSLLWLALAFTYIKREKLADLPNRLSA